MENRPKYGYVKDNHLVTDKPSGGTFVNSGFILTVTSPWRQGINGISNNNLNCFLTDPKTGRRMCDYSISLANLLNIMEHTTFINKVCQSPIFFAKGGGLFDENDTAGWKSQTENWVAEQYRKEDEKKALRAAVNNKSKGVKRWQPGRMFKSLNEEQPLEVYLGKCNKILSTSIWTEDEHPYSDHIDLAADSVPLEIMINSLGCMSLSELLKKQTKILNTYTSIFNHSSNMEDFRKLLDASDLDETDKKTKDYMLQTRSNGAYRILDRVGFHMYFSDTYFYEVKLESIRPSYLSKSKPQRVFCPDKVMKIDIPIEEYFKQIRMTAQALLNAHLEFSSRYVKKEWDKAYEAAFEVTLCYYLVCTAAMQIEYGDEIDKNSEYSAKSMIKKAINYANKMKESNPYKFAPLYIRIEK